MPEVVEYIRRDGSRPFAKWFDSLDATTAARVTNSLARMAEGNRGDVKHVGSGVIERRLDLGPGYRIYFGQEGDALIVLLIGGTKSRQQADISKAQSLWAEYRSRKKGN